MMRWFMVGLGVVGVAVGAAGWHYLRLADLRPDTLGQTPTAEQQAEGRRLLMRMVETVGGPDALDEAFAGSVTARVRDTWHSRPTMAFMGTGDWSGQTVELTFQTDHGHPIELAFLEGARQGDRWMWGPDGTSQTPSAAGEASDWALHFWTTTYRYFTFMPHLLPDAELVASAGAVTLDGTTYDRVYLTWGSWEPSADVDQYVLWLARPTGTLAFAQYTIRDILPGVTSCVEVLDASGGADFSTPRRYRIIGHPTKREPAMHEIEILSIRSER